MYAHRCSHIGASALAIVLAACSDSKLTEPLGPAAAEVPVAGPRDRLAHSAIVQDTAYTAQGNAQDLVGAVVNVSDGTITKNGVSLGGLAAPGPVGPTGGTGGTGGGGGVPPGGDASNPAADDPSPPPINGTQFDIWCMIRIWYNLDTGEIVSTQILYCWDDGSGGSGGGGGGNNNNSQSVTFSLSCVASVTRGDKGRCSVTAFTEDDELVETGAFTFSWSSTTGASDSGKGMDTWEGTATDDATVTVSVNGYSDSKEINVRSRFNWGTPQVYAPRRYSRSLRGLGLYFVPQTVPRVPAAQQGGGPWKGRYYMAKVPEVKPVLYVHADYSNNGPEHSGAQGTCRPSSSTLPESASYKAVNRRCLSLTAMESFRGDIIDHERDHESGINACLGSSTAQRAMDAIEKLTDSSNSKVTNAAQPIWAAFYNDDLQSSGFRASAYTRGASFRYHTTRWRFGYPGIIGENGQHSC